MTTATLLPLPRGVFYDSNGKPLSGGFVYTFVPGGTTPKMTWEDANVTTENSNPIVLDSNGSCLIYGSGSYQLTVTDYLGNQIPAYSGLTIDTTTGTGVSSAMLPVVSASTVEAALTLLVANPITQPLGTHFYQQDGAVIDRLANRVFVGVAVNNDGNYATSGEDWLENLIAGTTSLAQFASIAQIGNIGVLGATRSSDAPLAVLDNFAVAAFGINDNVSGQQNVVTSSYIETRHSAGAFQSINQESDIISLVGSNPGYIDPYHMFSSLVTANIWLSCGRPDVSSGNATVAIGILNNAGSTFATAGRYTKGIVFDYNSLVYTSGAACAIALAQGMEVQWFNSGGQVTAGIAGSGTASNSVSMEFSDLGVTFAQGLAGPKMVTIPQIVNAKNGIQLVGSATGQFVQVLAGDNAGGSDADIDIFVSPKGSGRFGIGTGSVVAGTPASFVAARWLPIKDASGTIYYLPLSNGAW